MGKRLICIGLFSLIFILNSCGSMKIKAEKDFYFNKTTTLALKDDDKPTEAIKEFKYLLAQGGFNIVSVSNAAKAINFPNEILQTKNNTQIVEIYSIKDLKSVYVIQIAEDYFHNPNYFGIFNARVMDVKTNTVVITARLDGGVSAKKALKKFADELIKRIK